MPFVGDAHVGYIPASASSACRSCARVVEHFARAPPGAGAADRRRSPTGSSELRPQGVGVVLEAEHMCMTCAGAEAGRAHDHLRAARPRARRPAHPPGVPRAHRGASELRDRRRRVTTPRRSRRRPGRRQAAETLREEGFDGRDRARRLRAGAPLRAAAALEGLPARRAEREEPTCTTRLVRRARDRAAHGHARSGASTRPSERTLADGERLGTTGCCSPPASAAPLAVPGADLAACCSSAPG